MLFKITSEDHILKVADEPAGEAGRSGSGFASEQELQKIVGEWPMKRLVAIWNGLPGVAPVAKFENREIAIARIWRAIQSTDEPKAQAVRSRRTGRSRKALRAGSKGAQVMVLLSRPEGATLREIRSATGWQAHTVRGFISRTLRKQGRKVRSFRNEGERVYRVKP